MSADHQARGGVSEAEVGPSLWLEHRANGSYLVRRSGDVSACLAMLSKEEAAALEAAAQVRAGQDHGGGAVGPSYRALVEFYDAHVGTPCEEVRHRATVRELHRRAQKAEGQIARGGREYLLKRLASYIGRTSRQRKLLAAAEARAAKAVEVLRHVEWAENYGLDANCPVCLKFRRNGHAPRCSLATLLSDHPAPEPGVEAGLSHLEGAFWMGDLETGARKICAELGEDPDQMVMPGITMPQGYTKPTGPARPWWTFKMDEAKACLALAQAQRTAKDGGGDRG